MTGAGPVPEWELSGEAVGEHAEERELEALLRQVRAVLFRHPIAAQAAFAALVAEGRRFAREPEGEALMDGLSRSPTMAQARMLWEVTSMNAFEEDPSVVLPGVLVDQLVSRMRTRVLEPILARVFGRQA